VYEHDQQELDDLGWEEFITRQWESIYVGYRSWTGLRTQGRRWTDLLEAGLGCSQDVADWLVRRHIMHGPDRGLHDTRDGQAVVAGMLAVLTDVREGVAELADGADSRFAPLAGRHARLVGFITAMVPGPDG
jgi:hypothetical protein